MLRKLYGIGLLSLVTSSLGCTVCCSPDDFNYAAYGGRWQRHDRSGGRVSSVFAEAGYDSLGDVVPAESMEEHLALPGDDNIRPASYDEPLTPEISAYIE